MLTHVLLLIFGLFLLAFGADLLVKGASGIARHFHISDLAIGLTIVAFGTSAPELIVNIIAAWKGSPDIVFGNVIGSNNFNLFIILGITGLIVPLTVQSSTKRFEIPFSLVAVLVLFILSNDWLFGKEVNILSRYDSLLLLVLFLAFLWYVFRQSAGNQADADRSSQSNGKSLWLLTGLVVLGLGGLVWGGELVVSNAVSMAQILGISEKIIGLTIVAAGTSLPELATSVVAAIRKNHDIAIGNIIGSNIFNIFLILGVSSMVRPTLFTLSFNQDLLILASGTVFLFLAIAVSRKNHIGRWGASVLLISYLSYTVWMITHS